MWLFDLINMSSSNVLSDREHLSGLNILPAILNTRSTGEDEAGTASFARPGKLCWFSFQYSRGLTQSSSHGWLKYWWISPSPELFCWPSLGTVGFMKLNSFVLFLTGEFPEAQLTSTPSFAVNLAWRSSFTLDVSLGLHQSSLKASCQWEVNWFQWYLRFHFPDSSALLHRRMLFFVIQSHTVCSHEQFKYLELLFSWFFRALSLTKIYWKPPLDLYLFLVFQTIRMQLISWSFSQVANGPLLFLSLPPFSPLAPLVHSCS